MTSGQFLIVVGALVFVVALVALAVLIRTQREPLSTVVEATESVRLVGYWTLAAIAMGVSLLIALPLIDRTFPAPGPGASSSPSACATSTPSLRPSEPATPSSGPNASEPSRCPAAPSVTPT